MTDDNNKPPPPRLEHHPNEPFIPWQWWSGDTYLAGFSDRGLAKEYGKERGWIK